MPPAAPFSPRPLIVRCGAFGDMVLLTALIRPLHRRFGTAVDIMTSGPWSAPLLRGQPGVGDIYSVRSRKTPYWLSADQHRVVRQLRERGAGPTWYCDGNDAALPMLRRAGISVRAVTKRRSRFDTGIIRFDADSRINGESRGALNAVSSELRNTSR